MKTKLALTILGGLALAMAPVTHAALINVNFNAFTPNTSSGVQDPAFLVGPAGGLGTTWNQFANPPSGAGLLDSTGAATGVGFTTNFSEGRFDNNTPTPMMRATLTDFTKGLQNKNVTINGLEAGGIYDIWLVSHRHQGGDAERQAGEWIANNPTSSPVTQVVDGRVGALTGNSFVDGRNYALFERVVANGAGMISFTGNSFAGQRMHLNGFQIMQVPEPSTTLLVGLGGLLVFARRRR